MSYPPIKVSMPFETKKIVSIVLIGNFLDFFDLMLAVHLTLVLSKIFLPVESALAPLLMTFTFCSSFCIRPLAALFWGYIGDNIGRVPVLIATTFLMSISCIIIPNIPPYAEWGMLSAVLFLTLRLVQGFASGGECIAADVFITETVPKPMVYFCSALVEATCSLGGLVACGIGALCLYLSPEDGWKIPFYIGSGVAVLGTIARKTLKETPEFLRELQKRKKRKKMIEHYTSLNLNNRNIFALFAMYFFPAVAFYFSLAYIPSLLVNEYGMSPNVVMTQTTCVLFIVMCSEIFYGLLGLKIDPFKILKFKLIALLCILPILAIGFNGIRNYWALTFIQVIVNCLGQGLTPATPKINKSFPVSARYTYLLFIWAFSHSLMYLLTAYVCEQITSFSLLCLVLFVAVLISLIGANIFVSEGKSLETTLNSDKKIKESPILQETKACAQDSSATDIIEELYKIKLIKKWIKKIFIFLAYFKISV
ncbi:MAG: MFS transporter [Candidatus Paracaedibacteraceae bacterium]|nr:MFS transporter [Candidatus Paracaedibacteraceae bacterium]